MKRFDFEKAKNGAEVCLSDGTPVKILDFYFNGDLAVKIPFKKLDEGGDRYYMARYDILGNLVIPGNPNIDKSEIKTLYMKTTTGYMNLYRYKNEKIYGGSLLPTKEDCERDRDRQKDFFCLAKVELIEEEGGEE